MGQFLEDGVAMDKANHVTTALSRTSSCGLVGYAGRATGGLPRDPASTAAGEELGSRVQRHYRPATGCTPCYDRAESSAVGVTLLHSLLY